MSELLLQRRSGPAHLPPRLLVVARTLTLTTLRRLDGIRKGVVIQFLSESELIKSWSGSDPYGSNPNRVGSPVIDLSDADLRGVVMNDAVLVDGAAFRGTDMRHAQFRNAFIIRPDFMGADLRYADFSGATINTSFTVSEPGACLSGARFVGTSLLGVTIWGAGYDVNFTRARLSHVRLKAHLTNVTLDGATFTNTKVPKAWRTPSGASSRSEIDKECAVIRYEERKGAQ